MEEAFLSLVILICILPFSFLRKAFFVTDSFHIVRDSHDRLAWVDVVRGLAIMGVVLIHVTYYYGRVPDESEQIVLNMLNNLFRFAIPVFFITAGLLQRDVPFTGRGILNFYRSKVVSVLVPYLVSTTIIVSIYGFSFRESVYLFLTGTVSPTYWFVIVLIQFYLLYPFFQRVMRMRYALVVSFVLNFSIYLMSGADQIYGVVLFVKFMFFFVFGVYMRGYFLDEDRKSISVAPWLTIIFIYLLTFSFAPIAVYNVRFFYGVAVFFVLYIYRDYVVRGRLALAVMSYGRHSLWIYLTHLYVVRFFYITFVDVTQNFYVNLLCISISSLIMSFVVGVLVEKIYSLSMRGTLSFCGITDQITDNIIKKRRL
jgi:surface polysaccharide O-acyltransferase-like enzyme